MNNEILFTQNKDENIEEEELVKNHEEISNFQDKIKNKKQTQLNDSITSSIYIEEMMKYYDIDSNQPTQMQSMAPKQVQINTERSSFNPFRRLFLLHIKDYISWLKKEIFSKGQKLELIHIPDLDQNLKAENYSKFCFEKLENILKNNGEIDLWELFKVIVIDKKQFFIIKIMIILTILIVSKGLVSVFLNYLLNSVLNRESIGTSYIYAFLFLFFNFIGLMSQHYFYLWGYEYSTITRMSIANIMYYKILSLKNFQVQQYDISKIINLLSTDLNIIEPSLLYIFVFFSVPITLIVSLFILWTRFNGVTGLILLAILICVYPIQLFFQKQIATGLKEIKKLSDKRVKLTNELIEGIRLIKMYAWEQAFQKMILTINNQEFRWYVYSHMNVSLMRSIAFFAQLWSSLLFFILVYYTEIATLDVPSMLSTIQLAFFIRFFTIVLGQYGFDSLVNLKLTLLRIIPVLSVKTVIQNNKIENLNKYFSIDENKDKIIQFQNYSSYWTSQENQQPTLKNINLSLNQGELVGVIGKIGSGKSTLLWSLMEEIPRKSGNLSFFNQNLKDSGLKVAYVEQEPFIFPDSIQNNILFGEKFDKELYVQVLRASCLDQDLTILPSGDQTFIGEKGINISGGQKARISLARAFYQQADIYLLDDPLSAVDASVAKQIFELGIKRFIFEKKKINICKPFVILCTHQVQYTMKCDKIVILDDGCLVAEGKFSEVEHKLNMIGEEFLNQLKAQNTIPKQITKFKNVLPQNRAKNKIKAKVLYKAEVHGSTTLGFGTYKRFFQQWPFSQMILIIILFNIGSDVQYQMFYKVLAKLNKYESENNISQYFLILGMLCLGAFFSNMFKSLGTSFGLLWSNRITHNQMLNSLCLSPVSYFDQNPSVRILNRFSIDKSLNDYSLNNLILDVLELNSFFYISILFIVIVQPIFLVVFFAVLVLQIFLIRFSYQSIIQTKENDLIQRGPLFNFLKNTLNGLILVQNSRQEEYFQQKFEILTNQSSASNLTFYHCSTFFGMNVHIVGYLAQFIGTLIVLALNRNDFDNFSSAILVFSIFNDQQQWCLRQMVQVHAVMGSTQRMYEIADLPNEAPHKLENDKLLKNWPNSGKIKFLDVSMRYRENSDLVLNQMNFEVKPGEKVGCVGRTGAGKSSIIQALFRLSEIEFKDDKTIGIYIDDEKISQIGLQKLRSSIGIIPQTPFLFSGTIRRNLDPLDQFNDQQIEQILEITQLKQIIDNLPQGILTDMTDANQVFSVGQKQLICLARVALNQKRIIVLDEATANLDMRTDDLIQKIIREHFSDSTVLTIAHRLNTVADYDKVMLVSAGSVIEFDKPINLLRQNQNDQEITKQSEFAKLVLNTGQENARTIFNIAQQKKLT